MRQLKHLPVSRIPVADQEAFRVAYTRGDLFDDAGGMGAYLAPGTRRMIVTGYRRWLGFLEVNHPLDLARAPADRITRERVRDFVEHLGEAMRPTSMAICLEGLHYGARFMDPQREWDWLRSIGSRLRARGTPQDRYPKLVPGWMTLDYGIRLMDSALAQSSANGRERAMQYRDGLVLAMLSLWPMRRRSIAALTVNRHLESNRADVSILLWPEDTKAKRPENVRMDERLVPYLRRYLREIRPLFPGSENHNGLWASCKRCPLTAGRLYDIARLHTLQAFGKAMGLHDFRRAAATFLATEAPEKVGLVPGILQQASPEIGHKYYILARSMTAGRRFAGALDEAREALRLRLSDDHPARRQR